MSLRRGRHPGGRCRLRMPAGVLALALFLTPGVSRAQTAAVRPEPRSLKTLLPAEDEATGWTRDGDVQEYGGDDLYTYIDGGAEIYHEYGFRRVVIQDYKNAAGKAVSLEVFEMETPAAAYGIFTFKRSGRGKGLPLGSAAELEKYYLNLWKGRFLATLTGFDEAPETVAGLRVLAAAVDAKIKDKADPPDLLAALPEGGLVSGSVKYLRGLLGLANVYPFYTARGLDFKEAVKGDYADGATLIVLDYGSAAARAAAWDGLRAYLETSDKFKPREQGSRGEPLFEDGKGRSVVFAPSGPRLLVGLGDSAGAALDKIRLAVQRPTRPGSVL